MITQKYNHKHVNALGKDGWLKLYRLHRWTESKECKNILEEIKLKIHAVMDGTHEVF